MNGNILNKLASKTSALFDTINKMIPLYEEIKPLYKNLVSFKNKFKNFNLNKYLNISKNMESNGKISVKKEENTKFSPSNPQFFL